MKSRCKNSVFLLIFAGLSLFTAIADAALSVTENQKIDFGNVVVSDPSGVACITVNTDGSYFKDPSIYFFSTTPSNGNYTITGGTPNKDCTFTWPSSVSIGDFGRTFTIDNYTTNPVTLHLDGSGDGTFSIGARICTSPGSPYPDGVYNTHSNPQINISCP